MKREIPFRLFLLTLFVCNVSSIMAGGIRVSCLMASSGSQVYEDARVRICLAVQPDGLAQVLFQNKTDWPIEVDRTRSFGYVGDRSFTFYTPGSQTESQTESYGSLIHDPLHNNHLLQTDTFYGESHTRSRTVEDRSVQAVAPGGVAVIYEFLALPSLLNRDLLDLGRPGGAFRFGRRGHFISPLTGERRKFRRGETCQYAEGDSPLRLAAYVQYRSSLEADGSLSARVSDYVQQIVVGVNSSTPGSFSFRSGGGNALISAEIGAGAALLAVFATAMSSNGSMDGMETLW